MVQIANASKVLPARMTDSFLFTVGSLYISMGEEKARFIRFHRQCVLFAYLKGLSSMEIDTVAHALRRKCCRPGFLRI